VGRTLYSDSSKAHKNKRSRASLAVSSIFSNIVSSNASYRFIDPTDGGKFNRMLITLRNVKLEFESSKDGSRELSDIALNFTDS
jgi:hypothetical protein